MDRKFVWELVAAVGSVGTPIFVVLFLVLLVRPKFARQEPYLKRVAKKYSIPPLNLRPLNLR
jgi:hypothetical protein